MNPSSAASKIIIDSSAIISLFMKEDALHKRAVELKESLQSSYSSLIIPAEIFSEAINIAGKKFGHTAAYLIAQEIIISPLFFIEEMMPDTRLNALQKFKILPSSVSFTDCIVMAVADYYETTLVFGFDEVFGKNGYGV